MKTGVKKLGFWQLLRFQLTHSPRGGSLVKLPSWIGTAVWPYGFFYQVFIGVKTQLVTLQLGQFETELKNRLGRR